MQGDAGFFAEGRDLSGVARVFQSFPRFCGGRGRIGCGVVFHRVYGARGCGQARVDVYAGF